jgi:hypothetical protein
MTRNPYRGLKILVSAVQFRPGTLGFSKFEGENGRVRPSESSTRSAFFRAARYGIGTSDLRGRADAG